MKIEIVNKDNRNLVNKFFIDNWFSTDMDLRGEVIDCYRFNYI